MEEILIQRAVMTTNQLLYDKGLFNSYANADDVIKNFLFTGSQQHSEDVNAYEIQLFCS